MRVKRPGGSPLVYFSLCGVALLSWGCESGEAEPGPTGGAGGTPPALVDDEVVPEPAPAQVARLTTEQVRHVLHDVFGEDIAIPPVADADPEEHGYTTVAAGHALWSPRGVESLEQIAYAVADQALDEARRAAIVKCTPAAAVDEACATEVLEALGRRLWRRPLTEVERDTVVGLATSGADTLGDFYEGLEFGLAALIQSPKFLFRADVGEPDPADAERRRYTDWEMASRLSFLLWDSGPDEALLDAAAAGELTTDEGLRAQIQRLMSSERARVGVARFFGEWLELGGLDRLTKDPEVFPSITTTLGAEAREETLRLVEAAVFEWDMDIRELLTTRRTFVNRRLASLYEIPAPVTEGFAETEMPAHLGRRGILGHISFLARTAHAASSSPTLRGVFIRERILCENVPLPPADVDTSIPEANVDAPTMRERMTVHFDNPGCASCHQYVDPIGLTFEHFDGLGQYRETEKGHEILTAGELDGQAFDDLEQLIALLANDRRYPTCIVKQFYRFASGTREGQAQKAYIEGWMTDWQERGFRFRDLVEIVLLSDAFRRPGPGEDSDEEVAQ